MENALVLAEIQADLLALEKNTTLRDEINFSDRAAALEFIDVHVLDRLDSPGAGQMPGIERMEIFARAKKLQETFHQTDQILWTTVRRQIQTGNCPPAAFRSLIFTYTGFDSAVEIKTTGPGYDQLDLFLNGLLALEAIPEPIHVLTADMVGYQKTPARILFELADLAAPSAKDIFFDLGSGLGQPAILFHLLSGVRSIGIDIEPAYHAVAADSAARLRLPNVSFQVADIRHADLTGGTIFFMYTPVRKSMLAEVLILLRQLAAGHTFRLFTYGPCSWDVGKEPWLSLRQGQPHDPNSLCFFSSD